MANPHFLSLDLARAFLELLDPLRDVLGPVMFQFEYLNKDKIPGREAFLDRLGSDFSLQAFAYVSGEEKNVLNRLLREMAARSGKERVLGMALKGLNTYFLLTLQDEKAIERAEPGLAPSLKALDVNLLHVPILKKILNIGAQDLAASQKVVYFKDPAEAAAARDAVKAALERHGLDVRTQVGIARFFIDLAVVDPDRPGRYLLGIECDGAAYHSCRAARDREVADYVARIRAKIQGRVVIPPNLQGNPHRSSSGSNTRAWRCWRHGRRPTGCGAALAWRAPACRAATGRWTRACRWCGCRPRRWSGRCCSPRSRRCRSAWAGAWPTARAWPAASSARPCCRC